MTLGHHRMGWARRGVLVAGFYSPLQHSAKCEMAYMKECEFFSVASGPESRQVINKYSHAAQIIQRDDEIIDPSCAAHACALSPVQPPISTLLSHQPRVKSRVWCRCWIRLQILNAAIASDWDQARADRQSQLTRSLNPVPAHRTPAWNKTTPTSFDFHCLGLCTNAELLFPLTRKQDISLSAGIMMD